MHTEWITRIFIQELNRCKYCVPKQGCLVFAQRPDECLEALNGVRRNGPLLPVKILTYTRLLIHNVASSPIWGSRENFDPIAPLAACTEWLPYTARGLTCPTRARKLLRALQGAVPDGAPGNSRRRQTRAELRHSRKPGTLDTSSSSTPACSSIQQGRVHAREPSLF